MSVSMCGCAQCSALWLGGEIVQSSAGVVEATNAPQVSGFDDVLDATVAATPLSTNPYILSLQYGYRWTSAVRYSFPETTSNYELHYSDPFALTDMFSATTARQKAAVRDILGGSLSGSTYMGYGSFSSVISLSITETANVAGVVNTAEIRVANTDNAGNTAYAIVPTPSGANERSGDVWIGYNYASYQTPVLGGYGWFTHIHELGHAFGLKHSHAAAGTVSALMPTDRDNIEFTVMSYRSYIGAPESGGYKSETYGYAQTLMMYDIAALQLMYGANFDTNSSNTTYSWDQFTGQMYLNGVGQGTPGANKIFLTVWDGGGTDTYDLSNYTVGLTIDLTPGGWSTFSGNQLAVLQQTTGITARGSVYNALLYDNDARSYIENATGGSGNDRITGNAVANVLNGGGGDDVLFGGDGADTLIGGSGSDQLDGNAGADAMAGGTGHDWYIVDDVGDTVTELANQGSDKVFSHIAGDYTLGAHFESLELMAAAGAATASGNELNNTLVGNSFANGLYGFGGDDVLIGGLGADTMVGGSGFDTYIVDDVGDVVTELSGEGIDLVQSSVSFALSANVENLTLAGSSSIAGTGNDMANVLRGNAANNTLTGLEGNDTLMGEQGADTMIGGLGDDIYYVDSTGDSVVEQAGEGTDWVQSTVSYVLSADVENLTITGGSNATGNALANVLEGNSANNLLTGLAGNDTLDGKTGADTMIGGTGDDTYVVDNAGDVVTELSGEGTDLVRSSLSHTLGANFENLTLASGAGALSGTGNASANVIVGNEGNNTLSGLAGNDTLEGGSGNDTLDGGSGGDTAVFSGLRSEYQVVWDYDVVRVTRGSETDTLYSIEQLSFSDGVRSMASFGPTPSLIESFGSTHSMGVGNRIYLRDADGDGPHLKYQGAAVVTGQFGAAWATIGAELVGSGYQIVWKNGSLDQYAIWNADASGTLTGMSGGVLSATSKVLQALEATFQQDLNGNGQIAFAPATIESAGATDLVQIGSEYQLQDSGGTGPWLTYQGANLVTGQFGAGWTMLGTEQVSGGYQIVFKNGSLDEFAIWNANSSGAMTGMSGGVLSASSMVLQALETTFQQDLNGNGQIGIVPVTIESAGATDLVQIGNQYQLQDSGGAGPWLNYQGSNVMTGQFGAGWTAIGVEQVSGGYQIVFKNGSFDQYAIWNANSSGMMTGLSGGILSASSTVLQTLETTFQQDLNGNGQIGVTPPTPVTVEAAGSTRLVRLDTQYQLQDSGGSGPWLSYQGANVVTGQFGAGWTAIGVEQVSGGYQIVFKNGSLDEFAIWNASSSGAMTGMSGGILSASSATMQMLETTFQQDFNGNSEIGITPVNVEAAGSTKLVLIGNQYQLQDSSNAGPMLSYQGANLVTGHFGAGWTAIGVEQVSGGYQIVFKNGALDQYAIWNANSSGVMTGMSGGILSASSATMQMLETTFQQDFNGNSEIGITPVNVETAGSTKLVLIGNQYQLQDSGGAGPMLSYQGANLVTGQFGAGWTMLGVEQIGSGYQIVWKNGSMDQYAIWNANASGAMIDMPAGILSGSSTILEALETTFQQDLNNNGQIGVVPVTIESAGATDLVRIGSQYQLQDSGGAGPMLTYQGTSVAPGRFGEAWTPIGAEQVSGGYLIAWRNGSLDQYVVWNVNTSGAMIDMPAGLLSGSSTILQTLETTFQQDLNGSGLIGSGGPTSPGSSATPAGQDLIQAIAGFPLESSGDSSLDLTSGGSMQLLLASNERPA